MLQIHDAQSIRQLALEHLRDPETVRAITQQIVLMEAAQNRRLALRALVDQLLVAGELDAAVSAARLAPDLTPTTYVNNVDYWLKGALLLNIVDQLLDRREAARAAQLLDEATLSLAQLPRYDPYDLPLEPPWLQLTRRYMRVDLPERVDRIWDLVIPWARSIEQSLAVPDPAWFQPEDGSRFLLGIVAEMLQLGQRERALATAGAIQHEPYRTQALALVSAPPDAPAPAHSVSSGPGSAAEALQPVTWHQAAHSDVGAAVALVRQLLTRRQGVSAERADDLARAGELLAEIGLTSLREVAPSAADLWEQARRELVALLEGFDRPGAGAVTPRERVRVGRSLAMLGDPRIPLRDDEWRASLAARSTAFTCTGTHYWRYVPAGRSLIGGWAEYDPYAGPLQRDQWTDLVAVEAFWIARLPVTVAQFAQFVADGYANDAYWTHHGRQWRAGKAAPRNWCLPGYSGANQPVSFVTWYEVMAYCRWLSARLDAALPVDYTLRLPSEAEWETAASYDGTERRRDHPWGSEPLTEERAVTATWQLSVSAPVGLCPAGMAACGALDLVGNVYEWSGSAEESYPRWANDLADDHPIYPKIGPLSVPARGTSWREFIRGPSCGARFASSPDNSVAGFGFRLVLASRQA